MNAMLAALRALDVPDDPARTSPPDWIDGKGRRFQMLEEAEQRTKLQDWVTHRKDEAEGLLADLMMDLDPAQLLANFAAGDDMLNGVLINRMFMSLGQQVEDDPDFIL